MKKKLISLLVAIGIIGGSILMIAAIDQRQPVNFMNTVRFFQDVYFEKKTVTFKSGSTLVLTDATITGTGKITATHIADRTTEIPLPLGGFTFNNGGNGANIASYSIIDGLVPTVHWGLNNTTPMLVTFRVPNDYVSGGVVRILANQRFWRAGGSSGVVSPASIDFATIVNTASTSAATASTQYAAYHLSSSYETSPQAVTFTITDTLSAGKYLTIILWKDYQDNITWENGSWLGVKAVDFYYTATQ